MDEDNQEVNSDQMAGSQSDDQTRAPSWHSYCFAVRDNNNRRPRQVVNAGECDGPRWALTG